MIHLSATAVAAVVSLSQGWMVLLSLRMLKLLLLVGYTLFQDCSCTKHLKEKRRIIKVEIYLDLEKFSPV